MKTPLTSLLAPLVITALVGCNGSTGTKDAETERRADLWPEQNTPLREPHADEADIEALLERMSLEEKVGQMIQPELRNVTPEDVKRYHLGSILNGGGSFPGGDKDASAGDWLALADDFYRASMDDSDGHAAVPILWATDAVHGHNNVKGATLFPHNIGLGATGNPDLIRDIGAVTAREVAVTGLDWNFAPTLAVARDDRWGRTYEAYAEDPELLYDYGKAMVEGLQGAPNSDEFFGPGRVIATAKHYIADGGTEGGIDRGDAPFPETELRDVHGPGYFGALDGAVQTVMASFSSWQGEKLHGHGYLMTEVLKQRLGFDGLIVGDWNGHEFVDGCRQDSCPQAVNAGLDIFMVPDQWRELHENTVAQVRSGEIPEARIDDAVRRILRVKFRANPFDKGLPSERPLAGETRWLGADEHREVARQAVRESLVLLKNRNRTLPIDPASTVLVAGDGADDIGKQNGGWTLTWQGTGNDNSDFPGASSIYDGLRDVIEAGGGSVELSADGRFDQKPDLAVVVFGEDPYAEMQGDRGQLDYEPESDLALLKRLRQADIPVVSVFLTGRPLWVNPEINASDAFVVAWLPGSEGAGVADVLVGDANGEPRHDFSGTLTYSWPARADQTPLNRGDGQTPLFPYGFGLTYDDAGDLESLSERSGLKTGESRDRRPLFDGRALEPWRWVLSDVTERSRAVTGSGAELPGVRIQSVDRRVQEDARQVIWSGAGPAEVALRSDGRVDLSAYEDGSQLRFDVRVDTSPTSPVSLGMRCGQDCVGRVDIGPRLSAVEPGEWHTLSVDMSCLVDSGVDPAMTLSPFFLETDGELAIRLHDIRLEAGEQGKGRCP